MGKGPFTYEGAGRKCMSSSKGALKSAQGKMSCSHGQHGGSKSNNMTQNTGGYRIGSGTRTFGEGTYKQAGPKGNYPSHADQPAGHKKNA